MNREIKSGIILSYALLICNTLYSLIITPYILKYVGDSSYGVYKSVASISSSLAVMDLGLGTTMTRYMAKYYATGQKKEANNFAGMIFAQFGIVAMLIFCVGIILISSIDKVYSSSFADTEIALARTLLIILIFNMILRLFENLFFGVLSGYEMFKFANGIKLTSIILKFGLILIFMPIVKNVLLIVLLESLIAVVTIIVFMMYSSKNIGIRPHIYKWDKELFRESFGYTVLMFIQTITIQFNGNIDNILIGARISAVSVTIYSMALQIFGMYENLSGSIANIMLPNVTRKIVINSSSEELQNTVIKAGRFQFILLAAALGGFAVLGRDFYNLWLGPNFNDCYFITLILIIPVTFPMIQNVALSILRAKNKMVYRTVTLAISCMLNCIVTIVGISLWGYWGAAVGTACSTILNLILMNIYYHKELGFNIFHMFGSIMHKITGCAFVSTIITMIIHYYFNSTWLSFIVNAIIFVAVYFICLYTFGLCEKEKKILFGKIMRRPL